MCPAVQVKPSPEGVPGAVTDPTRIRAEQLSFAGAQGTPVNGYLASPAGDDERARPAMIVIHTAAGLAEHAKDLVNRFANIGYVALGVDLYTREGGPPPMDDMQAVMRRLFAMSDATALGDLEGAADFLRAREQVGGKVGCIGFCMGGRYTLLFACASEQAGKDQYLVPYFISGHPGSTMNDMISLALYLKARGVRPQLFYVDLKKLKGKWVVDGWVPRSSPVVPSGSTGNGGSG